jgi:arylsulfatase A-like enzyme
MPNLLQRIRTGVLAGTHVALCYAGAEYTHFVLTLLTNPNRVVLAQQWRGIVALFAAYAVLGGVAGAGVALMLRRPDLHGYRMRKILMLILLLVFGANLLLMPLVALSLKLTMFMVTMLLAAAVTLNLRRRLDDPGVARQPGMVFALLIFICWGLSEMGEPQTWLIVFSTIAGTIAALCLTVTARSFLEFWANHLSWVGGIERWAKVAAVALLCFGPGIVSSRAAGARPEWSAPQAGAASFPNILLITLDTVRADHMGIYGYHRNNTPHLEELVRQSTLYTNFIAAAPMTLTSHASIFTGLYPQSHGAFFGLQKYITGRPLADHIPTLADVLASHGYRTMAVLANRYYLRPEFGLLRGFQFTDLRTPTRLAAPERKYLLRNWMRKLLSFGELPRDLDAETLPAEEVNHSALALLHQASSQKAPFFLFLNYTDAHVPYVPPAPFRDLYPGRDPSYSTTTYRSDYESSTVEGQPVSAHTRAHLVSQYDGAIAYLDSEIAQLFAYLKSTGQFDRTLIVITADHGEALGRHRLLSHGMSVYQDQVRVPLIIKYPGESQPARVETIASHVDLMPTILDVARIATPSGMEGISLRNAAGLPERPVVAQMFRESYLPTQRFPDVAFGLFSGRYKLIYPLNGKIELYDLAADPKETHNLYATGAEEVRVLGAKLVEWSRAMTPRYLAGGNTDPRSMKYLQSLGYAHPGTK